LCMRFGGNLKKERTPCKLRVLRPYYKEAAP
jgi:hypothetical protein